MNNVAHGMVHIIMTWHTVTKALQSKRPIVKPVVQPKPHKRLNNRLDNRLNVCIHWMFIYTIQPVVQPVVKPEPIWLGTFWPCMDVLTGDVTTLGRFDDGTFWQWDILTVKQYNYAFVAIDSFSRFPVCYALRSLTAKSVCDHVMPC